MRLWTWQKNGFLIISLHVRFNSLLYSDYLNEPNVAAPELSGFKKAYEYLWKLLRTDQLIWCFADFHEAARQASRLAFQKKGKVLWELDVPSNRILKHYCGVAWHWILYGFKCGPPKIVIDRWRREPERKDELEEHFHRFWNSKALKSYGMYFSWSELCQGVPMFYFVTL